MNYKIISEIILIGSSVGLGGIIIRKIPTLVALPEKEIKEQEKIGKIKRKIGKLNPFKDFSYEKFLHKALTKIRILSLKTDNKTANWLQKLRENSQRKKIMEDDDYWDEIKKATKR